MSMSGDDGVPSTQQVDQLLDSSKLAVAIENDKYKHLLDHAPVAVAVSRGSGAEQQVVYANKAFEALLALAPSDVEGQSWLCLDGFLNEDNPAQTLGEAIRDGEDFIGVFRPPGRSISCWVRPSSPWRSRTTNIRICSIMRR